MRRARYLILSGVLAAVCVAGQFVPLFNALGYEYGVAAGICFYLTAGFYGFWRLRDRLNEGMATAGGALLEVTSRGLWWLVAQHGIAVGVSLANAVRVKNCDPAGGFLIYLYVAGPASLLGLTLGWLAGGLTRRTLKAAALLAAFGLLSVALTMSEHYYGPRLALHNLVLGQIVFYFYNSSKTLFASFIWHRVLALLICGWLWALAYYGLARRSPERGERRAALWLALLASVVWVAPVAVQSDEWGVTPGNRLVRERLNARLETPSIELHYSPEEYGLDEARRVLAELEWAYEKDATALNLKWKWKVEAYLYSAAGKEELTGGRDVLFAKPWRHEIHVTGNLDDMILRHELVHTMAADFGRRPWGTPWNVPLIEGLADAISKDQSVTPNTHYETAGALKAGNLPAATAVMTNSGFLSISPYQGYTAAGSFVGFLILRYGIDKMKELYRVSGFGCPWERVYGKDLRGLDREWREFLASVPVSVSEERRAQVNFSRQFAPVFFARICPRERNEIRTRGVRLREQGKYDESLTLFNEFARLEPDNPDWALEVARTNLAAKRPGPELDAARAIIEKNYPSYYQLQAYDILESQYRDQNDWKNVKATLQKELELTSDDFQRLRKGLQVKSLEKPGGEADYRALVNHCAHSNAVWKMAQRPGFEAAPLLLLNCNFGDSTLPLARDLVKRFSPDWEYGQLLGRQLANAGQAFYLQTDWNAAEEAWKLARPYAGTTLQMRLDRVLDKVKFVRHFLARPPEKPDIDDDSA